MPDWPDWYDWELELNAHLEERMKDRGFDEVDLRLLIETAVGYRPDHVEGGGSLTLFMTAALGK